MRFCYGNKNGIRILEEAEFWKRQESEHTVVIREVTTDLEDEYVQKLEDFKMEFDSTEAVIVQFIEYIISSGSVINPEMHHDIKELISLTIRQSVAFVNYLEMMLQNSTAVRKHPTSAVVINHIIRESQYYIGIARAYLAT